MNRSITPMPPVNPDPFVPPAPLPNPPGADFEPSQKTYTNQGAFRYWCQQVIPLVYDDSLSYYELLGKVINYLNNVIKDVSSMESNVTALFNSFSQLQDYTNNRLIAITNDINTSYTSLVNYVNSTYKQLTDYVNQYFSSLDVQQEINKKLDDMVKSGEFQTIISPLITAQVSKDVTDWLDKNVSPVGSAVMVDKSLTISGAAADSKSAGSHIALPPGGTLGKSDGSAFTDYATLQDVPAGYYLVWCNAIKVLLPGIPDFNYSDNGSYLWLNWTKNADNKAINEPFAASGISYPGTIVTNTFQVFEFSFRAGRDVAYVELSNLPLDNSLTSADSPPVSQVVGLNIPFAPGGMLGSASGETYTDYTTLSDLPAGYYLMWCNAAKVLLPNIPGFDYTKNGSFLYLLWIKHQTNINFGQPFARGLIYWGYINTSVYGSFTFKYNPGNESYEYYRIDNQVVENVTDKNLPATADTIGKMMALVARKPLGDNTGNPYTEYSSLNEVPGGIYLVWTNAMRVLLPGLPEFDYNNDTIFSWLFWPKVIPQANIDQPFTPFAGYKYPAFVITSTEKIYFLSFQSSTGRLSWNKLLEGSTLPFEPGGTLGKPDGSAFTDYSSIEQLPPGYYLVWCNAVKVLLPNIPGFIYSNNGSYLYLTWVKNKQGIPYGKPFATDGLTYYGSFNTNLGAYFTFAYSGSMKNFAYYRLDNQPVEAQLVTVQNNLDLLKDSVDNIKATTELISPSGNKYTLSVTDTGELITIPVIPSKISIIGNSLLLGFSTFGMAASSYQHDYAYLLKQALPGVTIEKQSGTTFEGSTTTQLADDWINNTLNPTVIDNSVQLVIIQLGDNVNTDAKRNVFKTSCKKLILACKKKFPKARIAWAYGWYKNPVVTQTIQDACDETGAINIDFINTGETAHIGDIYHPEQSTTVNYTVDSFDVISPTRVAIHFTVSDTLYTVTVDCDSFTSSGGTNIAITGKNQIIVNAGVASHPNDAAFDYIADTMLKKLGIR